MKYQTISFFAVKGVIAYVTIATVIFSRVKITLFSRVKICFCGKAHLVFHWCLYNKYVSFISFSLVLIFRHISFTDLKKSLPLHLTRQQINYLKKVIHLKTETKSCGCQFY